MVSQNPSPAEIQEAVRKIREIAQRQWEELDENLTTLFASAPSQSTVLLEKMRAAYREEHFRTAENAIRFLERNNLSPEG